MIFPSFFPLCSQHVVAVGREFTVITLPTRPCTYSPGMVSCEPWMLTLSKLPSTSGSLKRLMGGGFFSYILCRSCVRRGRSVDFRTLCVDHVPGGGGGGMSFRVPILGSTPLGRYRCPHSSDSPCAEHCQVSCTTTDGAYAFLRSE